MNSPHAKRCGGLAKAALPVALVAGVIALVALNFARPESLRLMAAECHPVWREFHSGAFKQGDPLDRLLARHSPAWQRTLGDVTVCEFRPQLDPAIHLSPVRITAVRGRLVSAVAGSCNWWHTFFDETRDTPTLCAGAAPR